MSNIVPTAKINDLAIDMQMKDFEKGPICFHLVKLALNEQLTIVSESDREKVISFFIDKQFTNNMYLFFKPDIVSNKVKDIFEDVTIRDFLMNYTCRLHTYLHAYQVYNAFETITKDSLASSSRITTNTLLPEQLKSFLDYPNNAGNNYFNTFVSNNPMLVACYWVMLIGPDSIKKVK